MSLETLLEAARYIELQELKEQQSRRLDNTSATLSPVSDSSHSSIASVKPLQVQATETLSPFKREGGIPGGVTSTVLTHFGLKQDISIGTQQHSNRSIQNSFDIINPLVIDESSGEQKRKQPPMAFRSGTREVHNKLEKHRRAHLKECFDFLKKQLPATADEKKTSNLNILHSALRYIQTLTRRERELEHEMEKLAREKISSQQKLAVLKKEISAQCDNVDFAKLLPDVLPTLQNSVVDNRNEKQVHIANERVPIMPLPRQQTQVQFPAVNGVKEAQQQSVQTTALSVVPVGYPVSQGLVLVPKNLTELSPLVSTPTVAHFITAPQQLNGKVVPLVNAQYVVKPVVVVSTASRTS